VGSHPARPLGDSDQFVSLNQWQQVVVTYNEGSTANDPAIYINGVLQTLNEEFTPKAVQARMRRRARASATLPRHDRAFNGLIDEVRVASTPAPNLDQHRVQQPEQPGSGHRVLLQGPEQPGSSG